MAHNQIKTVSLKSHPNLLLLDLTGNQLTSIPDLNGLISLQTLILQNNKLEKLNIKNIEKCQKLLTLDISGNNISFTQEDFEESFKLIGQLKRLMDFNCLDNPFVSNILNFRVVVLSRLKFLTRLNEEDVQKKEISPKAVDALFANEVKEKLENTSATMKGAPSFIPIHEKEKPTFLDFVSVMKYTSDEFITVCGEKIGEVLCELKSQQKDVYPDGLDQFYLQGKHFIEKISTNQESRRNWVKSLVCSLIFVADNDSLKNIYTEMLNYLMDRYDMDFINSFYSFKLENENVFQLLFDTLEKTTLLDHETQANAFFTLSKILLDVFDPKFSDIMLGLFANCLYNLQRLNPESQLVILNHNSFLNKLKTIIEDDKWSLGSDRVQNAIKIIISTFKIMENEYMSEDLIGRTLLLSTKNLDPNMTLEEKKTFSLLLHLAGNFSKSQLGSNRIIEFKFDKSCLKMATETFKTESKDDTIVLQGLLKGLEAMIKYTPHGKDIYTELIKEVPLKKLLAIRTDHSEISAFGIIEYALKNSLISESELIQMMDPFQIDRDLLRMINLLSEPSQFTEKIIKLLTDGNYSKGLYSLNSEKGLCIQILTKLKLKDYETINSALLELIRGSSYYFNRYYSFSLICVDLINNLLSNETNNLLIKEIFHNESTQTLKNLYLEKKCTIESLLQCSSILSKGTPLFNRICLQIMNILKDKKNHDEFHDNGGLEIFSDLIQQETRIIQTNKSQKTFRTLSTLQSITITKISFHDLRNELTERKILNDIFSQIMTLKYKQHNDTSSQDVSQEVSDVSDSDYDEGEEPVRQSHIFRVHRKSVYKENQNVDMNVLEQMYNKDIPSSMWSFYSPNQEFSIDDFLQTFSRTNINNQNVYEHFIEPTKRIFVDKEFLKSDYYLLNISLLVKDKLSTPPRTLRRFLTRLINFDEGKLPFQVCYMILELVKFLLNNLPEKQEEFFYETTELCLFLSKFCSSILIHFKNGSQSLGVNEEELNFIFGLYEVFEQIIEKIINFSFISQEDYSNLVAIEESTISKVYHSTQLNLLGKSKVLLKWISLNTLGIISTLMFNIFKSPKLSNQTRWTNTDGYKEYSIEIKKKVTPEFVVKSYSILVAKYMTIVDSFTLYNIINLLTRINIVGSFDSNTLIQKILEICKDMKDELDLDIFIRAYYSEYHLICHTSFNEKLYAFCKEKVIVFQEYERCLLSNPIFISYSDVQTEDTKVKTSNESFEMEIYKIEKIQKLLKI